MSARLRFSLRVGILIPFLHFGTDLVSSGARNQWTYSSRQAPPAPAMLFSGALYGSTHAPRLP